MNSFVCLSPVPSCLSAYSSSKRRLPDRSISRMFVSNYMCAYVDCCKLKRIPDIGQLCHN